MRRLLWFWPLVLAIPVAIGVVIHANQSIAQPGGGGGLVTGLFSYTLYYFALTWPVWLMGMSQAHRMVISALVPAVLLLILAVLPLPRGVPFLDVTVHVASSDVWFRPGEALYGKLVGFAFTSPCEVPLWEAAENGLSTEVLGVTYQPDGKLLIQGFISKEGTLKNGVKLTRLLPDGSVDPSFKGQDHCSSLTPASPGRVWLQPDGRILLGSKSIFSSPNHEDKLALIISPEGEELRRVSFPKLPGGQHVEGPVAEIQLQPDGGLLMYGGFRREEDSRSGSPILRISPEGLPDLSSWKEMISSILGLTVGPDGTVLLYRFVPPPAGGKTFHQLVQLLPDGSLDTGFHPPL